MLIGMRCRCNQPDQNHPAWNDGIGHSIDKNSMLLPQISNNCLTEYCTSFCEDRCNRAFKWKDIVANLLYSFPIFLIVLPQLFSPLVIRLYHFDTFPY